VTLGAPILSAAQYANVEVVSANTTFNMSVVIVDQNSQIPIGNINFGSFTWSAVVTLYSALKYQCGGALRTTSSSVIIVNPTTSTITATNLQITQPGMYVIQLEITSSNQQYTIQFFSNGILVKLPSSKLYLF
jgi:hypothetical protein